MKRIMKITPQGEKMRKGGFTIRSWGNDHAEIKSVR